MDVPKDIHADGVHSQRFAHLDAVLPVVAWYAWIMEFGSFHEERPVVQQESLLACRECPCFVCLRIDGFSLHGDEREQCK